MIVRLWSARASEPGSRAYLEHFQGGVLPQLRSLQGYAGSTVLTRKTGKEVEILVATVWRSLEAIQQFAGPDFEGAVVAEQAVALLTEFDRRVRLFDVVMTDIPEGTR